MSYLKHTQSFLDVYTYPMKTTGALFMVFAILGQKIKKLPAIEKGLILTRVPSHALYLTQ